jgi:predicted  nucleic acid-binding Zn-ribbon protein
VTQVIEDTVEAVGAVGQAVGVVEQFALQTQERVEADARARVPADRIIDDSLEQISARITDLLMRVSDTRSTIARAGVYVDEEDGSVKIEGVKSLEGALFETQIAVNEIAGQIGLFASQQFVREEIAAQVLDPSQLPVLDDIIAQVNEVQLVLDAATASLAAKADASTVSTLGARQDQAELEISALDAAVAARALSTEVSAVEARVASAELELSTLDGAAFDIALRDVRRLSGESEASAVADLAGLLRIYEEGEQRRADLASARLSLSADIDEGRTALAQLEVELAAAIEASEALVLQEAEARADALSAEASARQDVTARVGDLETDVAQTSAAVTDLATATSDADSALAQRATSLEARADDLENEVGATSAAVNTLATASANADSALAQRATNLEARAGDLEDDASATSAALSDLATASATADSALAQRATNLEARAGDLEGDVSANTAAVSNLATASANADSALAQRATNLEARATDLEGDVSATTAAVSNLSTASANADAALAQRATNLEARAGDLEDDVSATSAALSDLSTTSANADSALAQRSTNLESTVYNATTGLAATRGRVSTLESTRVTAAGAVSAVTQTISASYGSLDALATATSLAKAGVDGLQAGYLWRARAGGVTGEVELVSNGVAAQFVVRSDRFKFVGDLAEFFSNVQITGDLIVDGAITSRNVEIGAISKTYITGFPNGQDLDANEVVVGPINVSFSPFEFNSEGGVLNPIVIEMHFEVQPQSDSAGSVVFRVDGVRNDGTTAVTGPPKPFYFGAGNNGSRLSGSVKIIPINVVSSVYLASFPKIRVRASYGTTGAQTQIFNMTAEIKQVNK